MDETIALQINAEEDQVEDDFYEKMEAPKYVDFTAPDHYRPDDSYWFCLRVGCDKKHEEELDFEAINKNFVLRVMAARSPNVRLRKALNRKESSANVKCPLTAPAKSSKSRMSRLAMVSSSMSHKVIDNKMKAGLVAKTSSVVTPNAKVKKTSLVAKALTTPRNPKHILNPDKFSSVQNHKPTSVILPKNKVVAKGLVFHSPKRVKTKYSVELNTPVKKLCSVMKKLEVTGGKKNLAECNQQLSRASCRKQLRGREVKSRVFDSLNSHRSKGQEGKSREIKKGVKGSSQLPQRLSPSKEIGNDFTDMDVDEKSRNGSQKYIEQSTETSMKAVDLSIRDAPTEVSSYPLWAEDTSLKSAEASDVCKSQSMAEAGNKGSDESDKTTEDDFHSLDNSEAIANDDKENASGFDDKENFCKVNENEDKENPERKLNLRKKYMKIMTPVQDECSSKAQKKSASITISSQVAKYRKPKPTNPKPFKLRTDERGILREANMEKRLLTPSKKFKTAPFLKRGQTPRKRQEKREDDNHIGQSERNTVVPAGYKDRMEDKEQRDQKGIIQSTTLKNPNGKQESKISRRRAVSERKNLIQTGVWQEKNVKKLEHNVRRRKSPKIEPNFAIPRMDVSTKKEKTILRTPSQLTVLEESSSNVLGPVEAASLCENDVLREILPTSATSRPSLRGKMHTTIPKEPRFHSVHVPRSCTRKMLDDKSKLDSGAREPCSIISLNPPSQ